MVPKPPPRLPLELLLEIVSNVNTKTFMTVLYASRALAFDLLASSKLRRLHPTLLDQLHLANRNKAYLLSVLLPHTSISADRGALQSAAAVGALDAVRVLLQHGAELYPNVGKTQSAVTVAARNGHCDVVRLLLEHPQAEYSPEALCAAAENGHLLVVAMLLADARQTHQKHELQRALCRAVASGVVSIVKLLLIVADTKGLPLDLARADEEGTPLQVAAKHGRIDVVRWLLEQESVRASIDAQAGNSGRTALHFAGYAGHYDVMRVLVRAGADREVLDQDMLRAGGGRKGRMIGWESVEDVENDPVLRRLAKRPKHQVFSAWCCEVWT